MQYLRAKHPEAWYHQTKREELNRGGCIGQRLWPAQKERARELFFSFNFTPSCSVCAPSISQTKLEPVDHPFTYGGKVSSLWHTLPQNWICVVLWLVLMSWNCSPTVPLEWLQTLSGPYCWQLPHQGTIRTCLNELGSDLWRVLVLILNWHDHSDTLLLSFSKNTLTFLRAALWIYSLVCVHLPGRFTNSVFALTLMAIVLRGSASQGTEQGQKEWKVDLGWVDIAIQSGYWGESSVDKETEGEDKQGRAEMMSLKWWDKFINSYVPQSHLWHFKPNLRPHSSWGWLFSSVWIPMQLFLQAPRYQ